MTHTYSHPERKLYGILLLGIGRRNTSSEQGAMSSGLPLNDQRFWAPWLAVLCYAMSNCLLSKLPNVPTVTINLWIGLGMAGYALGIIYGSPQGTRTRLLFPNGNILLIMGVVGVVALQVTPNSIWNSFYAKTHASETPPWPIGDPRYSGTALAFVAVFSALIYLLIWRDTLPPRKILWMLCMIGSAIMFIRAK